MLGFNLDQIGIFGPPPPTATPVVGPDPAQSPDPIDIDVEDDAPSSQNSYVDMDSQDVITVTDADNSASHTPQTTSTPPARPSSSSTGKNKAHFSPKKQTYKRRAMESSASMTAPAITLEAIGNLFQTQFSSVKADLAKEQQEQTAALQRQFQEQYDKYQNTTKSLVDAVKAHDTRLHTLEDKTTNASSKICDLETRVMELERLIQAQPQGSPPPQDSSPPPTPPLSFPDQVSSDLATRIAKAREYQTQNLNSFVVFKAKEHLSPGQTPEVFAQLVANLFGGDAASVESVSWLGQDKSHLKITLTLPLAEEIGSKFWQDRQSLRVKYLLAPSRTRMLRDAMSCMRTTFLTTRNLRPELLPERITATSVSFLGKDMFDAMDFLYPAIRLSDGRIIRVSHIVNTPNLTGFSLTVNPRLPLPGPSNRD
jgi:hypothetical protein